MGKFSFENISLPLVLESKTLKQSCFSIVRDKISYLSIQVGIFWLLGVFVHCTWNDIMEGQMFNLAHGFKEFSTHDLAHCFQT